MFLPLHEFVCDNCSQKIKSPNEGILEWLSIYDSRNRIYVNI